MAITHGHSDHIGGMQSGLNNFRPGELWIGALPPTASITALLNYAQSLGIRVVRPSDGEAFDLGDAGRGFLAASIVDYVFAAT